MDDPQFGIIDEDELEATENLAAAVPLALLLLFICLAPIALLVVMACLL